MHHFIYVPKELSMGICSMKGSSVVLYSVLIRFQLIDVEHSTTFVLPFIDPNRLMCKTCLPISLALGKNDIYPLH